MGPSHDLAFRIIAKKIREEKGITKGKGPDERSFKPRVASLFAVCGVKGTLKSDDDAYALEVTKEDWDLTVIEIASRREKVHDKKYCYA